MKFYSFTIIILLCTIACTRSAVKAVDHSLDSPEKILQELGLDLPEITPPVANYVHLVRVGNILYLSGKGPVNSEGEYIKGKLGQNMSVEQGKEAARLTGLRQLAVLRHELGSLDRVKRIVKVYGMVNSSPDFTEQSQVINGFSDLMVTVFGETGRHARSAVGMSSLPLGMAVEIEMIVEVK